MMHGKCLSFALALLVLLRVAGAQQSVPSNERLEATLKSMDAAAAKFHTTEANFEWIQWETVIGDVVDTQKGKIYFRRAGTQVEMAAEVNEPKPPKYVLFADDKIELYETGINRVTVHSAVKNREEFETFLVLGFGGSGHEMLKSFDVNYKGSEKIGDVTTEILDL